MRKFYVRVLALILCIQFNSIASAEVIEFESYEPGDHQKIFAGDWKINSFKSRAKFERAENPNSPLVVFNPGWGGSDKYDAAFKDMSQRLGNSYHRIFLSHSDEIDLAGRTVTIFQAVRAVRREGFNPSKIFVIGASGGGQEGIHSTHLKTSQSLGGDEIKIDAVVAFYPSCRVSFKDNKFRNASILMFLGGKDKVAPASLCTELSDDRGLKHAEIVTFEDAGHSWLMTGSAKNSRQRTWEDCKIEINESGVWYGEGYDSTDGIGKILRGMGKKCRNKVNMKTGREKQVYDQSVSKAVSYIKSIQ